MALALTDITNAVSTISGLVAVSPQNTVGYLPQNSPTAAAGDVTIAGVGLYTQPTILFNYEGEQTAVLQSDITDHFIEDNTAIQDQWSLKPIVITTQGFVGELNNVTPFGLGSIQQLANKLVTVQGLAPGLSITALLAYNEAFQAYQLAASAVSSAISAFRSLNNAITGGTTGGENVITNGTLSTNLGGQNNQQTMFQQFYGYQTSRTLFTIQTPWAIFTDMAIMSLKAIQDAETTQITDFEVSFKQLRFAQTQVSPLNVNPASRLAAQASATVQQGTAALGAPTQFKVR